MPIKPNDKKKLEEDIYETGIIRNSHDNNKYVINYVNQKYILLKLVKDFNEKMNSSITELKMPNLEKYLSSRFAFSSNQADNMCKYCEKFIPKSMSQHYRYCIAKRDFDIKNGIHTTEQPLFEPSINESTIENVEIIIPELPLENTIVREKSSRKSKK